MRIGAKGKYTKQRLSNPMAIAVCDQSGLAVRHADLVRQMDYRGNGLVWTGLWVNPKYADCPNPQNMIPPVKLDPIPVAYPRVDTQVFNATITNYTQDVSEQQGDVMVSAQNSAVMQFTVTGSPLEAITLIFQPVFNEFYLYNFIDGNIPLYAALAGWGMPPLLIPPTSFQTLQGSLISNDTASLTIIYNA